jgi:hypothetical protein
VQLDSIRSAREMDGLTANTMYSLARLLQALSEDTGPQARSNPRLELSQQHLQVHDFVFVLCLGFGSETC